MPLDVPEPIARLLRCPTCGGDLDLGGDFAVCAGCGSRFEGHGAHPTRNLDLRPNAPFQVTIPVTVGSGGPDLDDRSMAILDANPHPTVDFTGVVPPMHVGPKMMSWIPSAPSVDAVALDLGCGTVIHREVVERAGYLYVGADYSNELAPLLADAHCLPFADDSFDLVFTIAVFEHLRNPLRAMQEVARVLKPGGKLLGSVAFLEPFHDRSYFHHSALGVLDLFDGSGLESEWVKSMADWSVLHAQPKALFPGIPRKVADAVAGPLRALVALWWRMLRIKNPGYFTDERRLLHTTGAFAFAAHRPA